MSSPAGSTRVAIVRTGTANTASVIAAMERLQLEPFLTNAARDIEAANYVVLPGVGSFEAAAQSLDEGDLRKVLRRRIEQRKPTLTICLGMQLLCSSSEESPNIQGLGLIDQRIRRFPDDVLVPHLGWNRVEPEGCELLEDGYAYFANSFRLEELPGGWAGASTDYGGRFISALESGAVLACQFHPELSGRFGAELLARWVQRGKEVS